MIEAIGRELADAWAYPCAEIPAAIRFDCEKPLRVPTSIQPRAQTAPTFNAARRRDIGAESSDDFEIDSAIADAVAFPLQYRDVAKQIHAAAIRFDRVKKRTRSEPRFS